ncbi:FAD-binding oxidoreductase [Ruegeria sp. PrR005]|uniref:FAD-binding oxidoreductase n=1 Tax=Ruegeria sp. PrR005 TaxID=2706882 RepID=A0A6B2NUS2_9RHOB|nr:FAD-binding oxidoreductase [Ruegeria sp. PrR005]NDW45645.1 FAD-binding oxidoreductase [Ruegeria sp. PrR005]
MWTTVCETISKQIGKDRIVGPEDAEGRLISVTGEAMPPVPILRPRDTEELAKALEICSAYKTPVIPMGGSTGLVGGLRHTGKELYLSLELMNQIESIDPVNRVATVQAGVVLQNLQQAAEDAGLSFPMDLGSRGSATVGGLISTNAGGEKAFRFGMMREQVLGLEVVTASGQILDLSNSMIKNNTGYDLKHLFIGAEGTLGIVTRAQLRLRPHLANVNTAFALIPDFASSLEVRNRVEAALGNDLTAFEVMWPEFYEIATRHRTGRLPLPVASGIYLLFESEAGTARDPEAFETAMAALYQDGLVEDMAIAASEADRWDMWAIRNDIDAIIRNLSPFLAFDVSLPVSKMELCVQELETTLTTRWPKTRFARFGHMGDNNLHIVVSIGQDTISHKADISNIVYDRVTVMNGCISAEHGIGMDKLPWFEMGKTSSAISLMQTIRNVLDPDSILNPGKTIEPVG